MSSTPESSIKEHVIVDWSYKFLHAKRKDIEKKLNSYSNDENAQKTASEIKKMIEDFLNEEFIGDEASKSIIINATLMQISALHQIKQKSHSGSSSDILLDPLIFPVFAGHGGGDCLVGEGAMFAGVIAILVSGTLAAYGMSKDFYEAGVELYQGDRKIANAISLAVTGACIAGAIVAGMALLASNPIGWGFIATSAVGVGLALVAKGIRSYAYSQDAKLEKNSGLETDSRFLLTNKDVEKLEAKGYNEDNINRIKEAVRGLAIKAKGLNGESGFFGTKKEYRKITQTLSEIKQGNIPENIKTSYGITTENEPELNPDVFVQITKSR